MTTHDDERPVSTGRSVPHHHRGPHAAPGERGAAPGLPRSGWSRLKEASAA